jgi:lysophospholipase L1-like esterase
MRRLLFVAFVVAFFAGLLAAGLEIALRATGFSRPAWYQPDPQLGWTLRPETRGWYTEEGRGYVWISPAGLRDRSHEALKPKGVYRVAVLGGATAEAMQVAFSDAFWWRLEGALQQCAPAGRQVEMMNFGVSGYSTAQARAMLELVASHYQPDLVILAFSAAEDVPQNSARLAGPKRGPFEGRQVAPWERYAWMAADRLRAAQLANLGWTRYEAWRDASGAQAAAALPSELAVLAPPRDPAWTEAWAATEREIGRMSAFAGAHRARFAVAMVTQAAQVDPSAGARRSTQAALGVADLFYPERRIGELGRRDGFLVIPLAEALQRRAEAERIYFHGFRNGALGRGHWNENGHQAAAAIFARSLCAGFEPGKDAAF